MDRLPEDDRTLIQLYVDGVSYKTMAEMSGRSTDYMWKQTKRAIVRARGGTKS